MTRPSFFLAPSLAVPLLVAGAGLAHAADSFDNCTGFIDTLPANISTQGVWCLRNHVSTAVTGGAAILVAANNVTIDCNGFKVGGLAGGSDSAATGIYSSHANLTVRHCQIRGFHDGIRLSGDASLVEGNRIEDATTWGIYTTGAGDVIRGNAVNHTGGRTGPYGNTAAAITTFGDGARVADNSISQVLPTGSGANRSAYGILLYSDGALAEGNRIFGLYPAGTGEAVGITVGTRSIARGNSMIQFSATGVGIRGDGATTSGCSGNAIVNYATALETCKDGGGNVTP